MSIFSLGEEISLYDFRKLNQLNFGTSSHPFGFRGRTQFGMLLHFWNDSNVIVSVLPPHQHFGAGSWNVTPDSAGGHKYQAGEICPASPCPLCLWGKETKGKKVTGKGCQPEWGPNEVVSPVSRLSTRPNTNTHRHTKKNSIPNTNKNTFQRSLMLQMVLIVDYLSTSQCAFSTTVSNPLSLSSPQTWVKWVQRKSCAKCCYDDADILTVWQ